MPRKRRTRAPNGDGTVWFHRGRRRWVAEISFVLNDRLVKRTRWRASRDDAKKALEELRGEAGRVSMNGRHTVKEFAAAWLRDSVKPNQAENTHESYRTALHRWVLPVVGTVELQKLTSLHVQHVLSEIPAKQTRTRQNVFAVVRAMLNAALRQGLIPASPADSVERPRHRRKRIEPFTVDEMRQILEAVEDDRLHAMYRLAFYTGMRFGELAGLQWSDIAFDDSRLQVRRQVTHCAGRLAERPPKSESSTRSIRLPDDAVHALEVRRRLAMAEGRASSPWVFLSQRGTWLSGSNFRQRQWIPLLKRLGVPYRTFHCCRHTYATVALAANVPVQVVSHILGHGRPSVTLDIYSHLLEFHQADAVQKVRAFLAS